MVSLKIFSLAWLDLEIGKFNPYETGNFSVSPVCWYRHSSLVRPINFTFLDTSGLVMKNFSYYEKHDLTFWRPHLNTFWMRKQKQYQGRNHFRRLYQFFTLCWHFRKNQDSRHHDLSIEIRKIFTKSSILIPRAAPHLQFSRQAWCRSRAP